MGKRDHLVPTPITDSRGRRTVVYRRPATGASGKAPLPPAATPPSPAAAQPEPETYAERLRRIAESNARWRKGNARISDETAAAAQAAISKAEDMYRTATANRASLSNAIHQLRFEAASGSAALVASTVRFASYHWVQMEERYRAKSGAADVTVQAVTTTPISSLPATLSTLGALQRLDLLEGGALPQPGDEHRIYAQLRAECLGTFIRVRRSEGEVDDCMRLIDEYPERVDEISEAFRGGMHAAGIRALLTGDAHSALASGAL